MLLAKKEQEEAFEKILSKAQVEIKEAALQNIAWELHDNVGQLLSFARLELNMLKNKSQDNLEKINDISEILGKSLQEIRTLSKTLNSEYINRIGLKESINTEVERFKRINFINVNISIHGDEFEISPKDEIILFRIVQEFFTNTIKHAQATEMIVDMEYQEKELDIVIKDNGKGFDLEQITPGSGLMNMKSRAALINASFDIESNTNGTKAILIYPKKKIS